MSLLETLGAAGLLLTVAFTWWSVTRAAGPGQSPLSSVIEAWVNIAIGFGINCLVNTVMIPLATHGGSLTLADNWWMGWVFTAVSILRQYAIRRWFNGWLYRRPVAKEVTSNSTSALLISQMRRIASQKKLIEQLQAALKKSQQPLASAGKTR